MMRTVKICKHCHEPYKGVSTSKYCGNSCRQKAYRARKGLNVRPKRARKIPAARVMTCEYCHKSYWKSNNRQKFCCASHRVMFHRHLRAGLPSVLALAYGLPLARAEDLLEAMGATEARRVARQSGYSYNVDRRKWVFYENAIRQAAG